MVDYYKPKVICIARCKNEIDGIEEWIESLFFVDLFCITDNGSSDGTYEYLRTCDNVLVTRVEGFDEGRDFQILLRMAKAHDPEWLLKIDCDEYIEVDVREEITALLDQGKYDSICLRKYAFHFSSGRDKCDLTREYFNGGIYFARNSRYLDIKNKKIHVGGFIGCVSPAISNILVRHEWVRSEDDAIKRYETYSRADPDRQYSIRSQVDKELLVDISSVKGEAHKSLQSYNMDYVFFDGHSCVSMRGYRSFAYYRNKVNKLIFRFFIFLKLLIPNCDR